MDEPIARLAARLPELEWKLGRLGHFLQASALPRGLFRCRFEFSPQACSQELREDLTALQQQSHAPSARFMADRLSQKISVLVRLCQLHGRKDPPQRHSNVSLRSLSTRQQWLQGLNQDLASLQQQRQALLLSLQAAQQTQNSTLLLALQAELGELDRRLTLAEEALQRASSW